MPTSAISTQVFKCLTMGLVGLVAAVGVTLAVYGMAHSLGDASAAKWLWRAAIVLLMALATDLLLLVGALAVRQIEQDSRT